MRTKTFDKEYLTETLGLPDGASKDVLIEDSITGTGRWSIHHSIIFKDPADGKCYRADYSEGATEMQPERPWEYENAIEAEEVSRCRAVMEVYATEEEMLGMELVPKAAGEVPAGIRASLETAERFLAGVMADNYSAEASNAYSAVVQALQAVSAAERTEGTEEHAEGVPEQGTEQEAPHSMQDGNSVYVVPPRNMDLWTNPSRELLDAYKEFKKKFKDKAKEYFKKTDIKRSGTGVTIPCEGGVYSAVEYDMRFLHEKYMENQLQDVKKPMKALFKWLDADIKARRQELALARNNGSPVIGDAASAEAAENMQDFMQASHSTENGETITGGDTDVDREQDRPEEGGYDNGQDGPVEEDGYDEEGEYDDEDDRTDMNPFGI